MVCSEKLRRWSSSSIVLRRWVTGTPPVTHTYTRAIKQPTLHYLTRSVRRAAATCKQRLRTSAIRCGIGGIGQATSTSTPLHRTWLVVANFHPPNFNSNLRVMPVGGQQSENNNGDQCAAKY